MLKKMLSIMLATAMCGSLCVTALASEQSNGNVDTSAFQNIESNDLIQFGDVYIPSDADCSVIDGETIYTNFYDSVNHFTYSYYNTETHDHFAISDPIELPASMFSDDSDSIQRKSQKVTAHKYSFSGRYTVNGKNNGITFDIDLSTNSNVYINGTADMYSYDNGEVTTDEYPDGYAYKVTLVRNVLLGYEKTVTGEAGCTLSGTYSNCKSGEHYLIVKPAGGRMIDAQYIEGSGTIYYYA